MYGRFDSGDYYLKLVRAVGLSTVPRDFLIRCAPGWGFKVASEVGCCGMGRCGVASRPEQSAGRGVRNDAAEPDTAGVRFSFVWFGGR